MIELCIKAFVKGQAVGHPRILLTQNSVKSDEYLRVSLKSEKPFSGFLIKASLNESVEGDPSHKFFN